MYACMYTYLTVFSARDITTQNISNKHINYAIIDALGIQHTIIVRVVRVVRMAQAEHLQKRLETIGQAKIEYP